MRKQVVLNICKTEVTVDVTFDTIERIESVFNANADVVASIILANNMNVKYTTLASAIARVCAGYTDLKPSAIKEYVLGSSPDEIARFAVLLSTMCLYLRKHLDDAAFDRVLEQQKEAAAKKLTAENSSAQDQPSESSTSSPSDSGESNPQSSGG